VTARVASLLLALLAPLVVAADKPVLVPDISARQVQIRYSFTGAQLLLFGAVVYPGGRPPDRQVDIAVVLRGPVQPILVREKEKIGGLVWMNADSNRFRSAPSFYGTSSGSGQLVKPAVENSMRRRTPIHHGRFAFMEPPRCRTTSAAARRRARAVSNFRQTA